MRKYLIATICLFSLSKQGGATPCLTFPPEKAPPWTISQPGHYCVNTDLELAPLYDWHSMRKTGLEEIINIRSPDIHIDIQGHTLKTSAGSNTIIREGQRVSPPLSNITIRNGSLTAPAEIGVSLGTYGSFMGAPVSLPSDLPPKNINNTQRMPDSLGGKTFGEALLDDFKKKREEIPKSESFPSGNFVLENIKIRLNHPEDSIGALLEGADNIVRNCTIEVDGAIGLYIVGPRALIENNTILIHAKAAKKRPSNAAIKLDHADGTIIRNNRIIIEHGDESPGQVVSIIESMNVQLENNIVYGDLPTYRIFDEHSSIKETGTQKKKLWLWLID